MTGIRQNLPRPRKRWSQNFLKDSNIAGKVAAAARIEHPSLTIEIGAGQGILTRHLLPDCDQLIAVEIDPQLARQLPEKLDYPPQLEVVEQDFLEWDLADVLSQYPDHHKTLVGNLPYHITSPIIFRALDQSRHLDRAVFMIQKEVARRITGKPATKEYGILSVFCQFYARTEYLFTVPSHLFYPRPKVDSAVIRMYFRNDAEDGLGNPALFREIVRHTFGQRRKMLRNTLSILYTDAILHQLNIDLTRRPEQLTIEEFADLSNQIHYHLTGENHEQADPGH